MGAGYTNARHTLPNSPMVAIRSIFQCLCELSTVSVDATAKGRGRQDDDIVRYLSENSTDASVGLLFPIITLPVIFNMDNLYFGMKFYITVISVKHDYQLTME